MNIETIRVASLGMGWWSDVLADGVSRADGIEIVSCFTRSEEKRHAFAEKYHCAAASSYEEILADPTIQGVINTTPNSVHLETTQQAAEAGKHIFLDKPIANSVGEGMEITKICRNAGVKLSIGFQRRREAQFRWVHEKVKAGDFGILVQAEANISRDRLGAFDESHWRYTAEGMPGGASALRRRLKQFTGPRYRKGVPKAELKDIIDRSYGTFCVSVAPLDSSPLTHSP